MAHKDKGGKSPKQADMGKSLDAKATNTIHKPKTANLHEEVSPGSTSQSRNKSYVTSGPSRSS